MTNTSAIEYLCPKCGNNTALSQHEYCGPCEAAYQAERKEEAKAEVTELIAWINKQPDDADYCGEASDRIRELRAEFGFDI